MHRKNWLFANSVDGAESNAILYSLIESAKVNNLNIYKYINYLLEQLPQLENLDDANVLEKYLPWSTELPDDVLNFEGLRLMMRIKIMSKNTNLKLYPNYIGYFLRFQYVFLSCAYSFCT